MPKSQQYYSQVFNSKEGTEAEKAMAVLIAYANPPKSFFNPATWFTNRTYAWAVTEALQTYRQARGTTEEGDLKALLQALSAYFAASDQINQRGDLQQAGSAIAAESKYAIVFRPIREGAESLFDIGGLKSPKMARFTLPTTFAVSHSDRRQLSGDGGSVGLGLPWGN